MTVRPKVVVLSVLLLAAACGRQGSPAPRSSNVGAPDTSPTVVAAPALAATAAALSTTRAPTTSPTTSGPPIPSEAPSGITTAAVTSMNAPPTGVDPPAVAPPRPPPDPWLVAVRADGDLELWAGAGKVLSVAACQSHTAWGCVEDAAVSDLAVWFIGRYAGIPTTLMRASRRDGHLDTLSADDLVPGAIELRSIAVSADDRTLWFIAVGADPLGWGRLYQRDHTGTRPLGSDLAVIDVALSRDGRRLAYSGYRHAGDGRYPSHAVLVVREVATGVEHALAAVAQAETPSAATNLAWSRDGHHLSFDLGWEGTIPEVVDVEAAATLDDARPLPGIEPEAWQSTPTCWTGVDTSAVGRWRSSIEGPYVPGEVDDLDLASGRYRPRGVHLFALGMVCRDDGAVAVRPEAGSNDAGPLPTDLVVVRVDGSTTVLGRGYAQILAP